MRCIGSSRNVKNQAIGEGGEFKIRQADLSWSSEYLVWIEPARGMPWYNYSTSPSIVTVFSSTGIVTPAFASALSTTYRTPLQQVIPYGGA